MGQSAEFGKFLKAMRSRLTPETAGIAATSGGRRVPGLRREEIARLADVSTDYYTRLEQGRNIHPSRAVLDSVARALRLDPGEQAHMIDLLENCANSQLPSIPVQRVRPALRQLVDAMANVPALVLGRRTEVLAGNHLAFLLLAGFPAMPAAEHRVATGSAGSMRLHHPVVGDVDLNFDNLALPDDPDQVLRVFSAKPGSPSADSLTLLGSFGAGAAASWILRGHQKTRTNPRRQGALTSEGILHEALTAQDDDGLGQVDDEVSRR